MLHITNGSQLFDGLGNQFDVWNSHGDEVTSLPKGFVAAGRTESFKLCRGRRSTTQALRSAISSRKSRHTRPRGKEILQNFVYHICRCAMDWTMGSFIEEACETRSRNKLATRKLFSG